MNNARNPEAAMREQIAIGVSEVGEQDGYTLLETVVALALFVVVLVPAGSALARLVVEDTAGHKAKALRVAEEALEHALATQRRRQEQTERREGHWRIVRSVRHEADLWRIHVTVYWGKQDAPMVTLHTARVADPTASQSIR